MLASAFATSLVFVAACGTPPTGDTQAAQVQAIYNHSCTVGTSCHGGVGALGGVNLLEGDSRAATVGVASGEVSTMPYITPGDPDNSYLLRKVDNTFTTIPACMVSASPCGVRMPMVGGVPLSDAQIATIRDWITAGAPAD